MCLCVCVRDLQREENNVCLSVFVQRSEWKGKSTSDSTYLYHFNSTPRK